MAGLIAEKLGMSSLFQDSGARLPVTLLRVFDSSILAVKNLENDGYSSILVGGGDIKSKLVSKPVAGFFKKIGIAPVRHLKEFRSSDTSSHSVGDKIDISLFKKGQYVDVQGNTIGKGFAGVMKRHNFGGLEASHGVSISHRSHGSTGGCQDPGKVFRNKKMAGHMGAVSCVKQNLKVISIDSESNILIVVGSVPGPKGSVLYVTGAIKKS